MAETGASNYSIELSAEGDEAVVVARGELDLDAAPRVRHCLQVLHDRRLVLDLEGVTFLDSTIIGVLVAAQKAHSDDGGPLRLRGVQPRQMRVLKIAGVAEFLRAEQAIESFPSTA